MCVLDVTVSLDGDNMYILIFSYFSTNISLNKFQAMKRSSLSEKSGGGVDVLLTYIYYS